MGRSQPGGPSTVHLCFDSRSSIAGALGELASRSARRHGTNVLRSTGHRFILNYMVQFDQGRSDTAFAALSDATRRGVLVRLGRSDATISDLAETFGMTLTGMKKHIGVLEQAGLVTTEKIGRVRTCRLGASRLEQEAAWIERYRQLWDARFDQLDEVVEELKRREKSDERQARG